MTHTIYSQAPLPFMGQKRKFIKAFRQILKSYPDNVTIVDLFGGSGLLSHVAKRENPNATVVYNDFDNYQRRIPPYRTPMRCWPAFVKSPTACRVVR